MTASATGSPDDVVTVPLSFCAYVLDAKRVGTAKHKAIFLIFLMFFNFSERSEFNV
jgi:hypothetical protein